LLWVEAAAEIARRRPDAQFVIAGDGPMLDAVVSRVRALGLSQRFRFTGEVSNVRSIQGAADVLLLTSKQEGTPNVLLESQALETPVVTTDAGGAAACLVPGKTGLVIDLARATPASLAQAVLEAALFGPALRSRAWGRAHVSSTFAEDKMLDATLQTYGDPVIARAHQGAPAGGRRCG
jgi:glycosyltransferase involved in cell wall biosynthesis